ncbi:MAG: hypothetical protein K2G51_10540 [Lachnospiraceae bacterium]|nr:hypothetical protein [Lachnospiraceae bacterium]MDE7273726.1 hypothetical protein [Lachnospiraceae bacterium]
MRDTTFDMIENLMADHLDNALHESTEYKEALSAAGEIFEKLKTELTKEQQELLDQYFILSSETTAICEKIAYRQGMRDLFKILFQDE